MTTIAYHQYTNIPSLSGGSYTFSPNTAPLNTRQTPLQMGPHNLGVLSGKHPNPPRFYPSADDAILRRQYVKTAGYPDATVTGYNNDPSRSTSVFNTDTKRRYESLMNKKYKAPTDSSLYMSTIKSRAVGKSAALQNNSSTLSYKNFNTNDVNHALKTVRGGGCVAPSKKGAY